MNNGQQAAFAYDEECHYHQNGEGLAHITKSGGLTKREYFAAMAMQGLCANSIPGVQHMPDNLAKEAIRYADALLKELEK